jgi:hypothetical protein
MTSPLAAVFAEMPDPRREAENGRHLLVDVLTIAVSAVIAGADSWEAIAEYGRIEGPFFRRFLALGRRGGTGRSGPARTRRDAACAGSPCPGGTRASGQGRRSTTIRPRSSAGPPPASAIALRYHTRACRRSDSAQGGVTCRSGPPAGRRGRSRGRRGGC